MELNWLISSGLVDVILSFALCAELWWARHKLAAKGGLMREVVTRLIVSLPHRSLEDKGLKVGVVDYASWGIGSGGDSAGGAVQL